MAKFWSLLLAFLLSGLPLRFDVNNRPSFQISEGFHERNDCVPRSYAVWIVETDRAIYRIEKYDPVWDWTVARSEAVEAALRLEHTLDTIAVYCGGAREEKVRVEIVAIDPGDPLLDKPYATHDAAVLTFQHIRRANYVEALARAYLNDQPVWVAFGVAGVINGDFLDDSFLADYFSFQDTEMLKLSAIRFSEEICGEYEVALAKGVATSLVRFIKRQSYYNTLLEVIQKGDIGAIKRAWLDSIGVDVPYESNDEIIWRDARLFRNARAPMLIEVGEACFEIDVEKEYWLLQYDQSFEGVPRSANDFERAVAVSAMMQWNVLDALEAILPDNLLERGTIFYLLDPLSVPEAPPGLLGGNIYPYGSHAISNSPRTVNLCLDDLGQGTLPFAVAKESAQLYLGKGPQWYLEGHWLQQGVANYVAMTLPRIGDFSQGLDSAYETLAAAFSGEYPKVDGADKESIAHYYDMIIHCYLQMGGSLAEASVFDPVLYTNAAAYATMREMESYQIWENFQILQGEGDYYSPPDELITSFVCYLIEKASLPELAGVLASGEWEAAYGRTYDRLFSDWKASLPYIMGAKSEWVRSE